MVAEIKPTEKKTGHGISGERTSVWMGTGETPTTQPLDSDLEVDVCIVGAGIAGLTTAYLLAREGKRIAVLDHGPIGGGETGHTTAHLSNAIDDRYVEMERIHGERGAKLAAQSHSAAIDLIEAIATHEQINCDFERLNGYLFLAPEHSPNLLDRELEAAHNAGLADVERLERALLAPFDTGPCLRFPRQGQFHPLKYLSGLANAIQRLGGMIYTETHVSGIKEETPLQVETERGHKVTADSVVVATNSPINDRVVTHVKQAPYRTYAIAARIPLGSVPHALFWDTLDPYHYVRVEPVNNSGPDNTALAEKYEYLIVGGEDHKTGQADDYEARWNRLESWTRERFPMIQTVDYRWSGQVMETSDGLAFIGRTPGGSPHVLIATGDSGMGMTHGTIAGILLSDLILEGDHPWASLYSPSRVSLRSLGETIRENLNVAGQYLDLVTPGEVADETEIQPGHGAILRRGLSKIAAYRDEQGVLHESSALCTHMGCVVHWNNAEKIWDCPCHGSAFNPYGEVIKGPAAANLEKVKETQKG